MKKFSLKTLSITASVFCLLLITMVFASAAIVGDVEGEDKKVTASDARYILRASVGLEQLTEEQFKLADTDESGTVTASDARTVLRMSVELEETKHYFTKELLSEATCTETLKYKRVCTECDEDSYIEEYEALGHDYGEPEILEQVTCDKDGLEKYTCKRCGEETEVTVPGGHVWTVDEPTCTEDKYCTRGEHLAENGEKIGHTTDWGKCDNCKKFVTERHETAAAAVKTNFEAAYKDVEEAYDHIESSQGKASWLGIEAGKAKPLYESARAYYKAAYDACGDIKELAEIKAAIEKIIVNIDGILAQIEIIVEVPYIDADNYYDLVNPIDDLNYINRDSIFDLNNKLIRNIKW